MEIVDLAGGEGKKDLAEKDLVEAVDRFVEDRRKFFEKADCFVVEKQMKAKMKVVAALLIMAVKSRFPKCECYDLSPRSVRAYWGISGKDYAQRKRNSMRPTIMSAGDLLKIKSVFKKKNKFHVDAVEAALMAVYSWKNLDKLRKKKRYDRESHVLRARVTLTVR